MIQTQYACANKYSLKVEKSGILTENAALRLHFSLFLHFINCNDREYCCISIPLFPFVVNYSGNMKSLLQN